MEEKDVSEWWNINAKWVFRFLVKNATAVSAKEGALTFMKLSCEWMALH